MSGATVTVDIGEMQKLAEVLNHSALSASDRQSLMKELGEEIVEQSRSRILETQQDPEGKQWQGYAASTLRGLKAKGLVNVVSLLHRSGMLQSSIEVQRKSSWDVLVGSVMEYAAVHQWGYKPRNIPARPYLGLSTDDIADLTNLAALFLKGKIG